MIKKIPILPLLQILCFIIIIMKISPVSTSSIHDLLKSNGLPGGIFPRNVRSYAVGEDRVLEVRLDEPCEARFESLEVRFDSTIRGNLSYGGLIGVQGLTQEELFLWFPIKDIVVKDPSSGVILVNIGVAQKQLAFSVFEDPPLCIPLLTPWLDIYKPGRKKKGGLYVQK